MKHITRSIVLALVAAGVGVRATVAQPQSTLGYYRYPALAGDSIVFTAEGDLWRVPLGGGTAQRLTSHPAEESHAAVSPDGRTVAFSASYEGPTEVYTLSLDAPAPPQRQTWEGANAIVVGWTPQGEILYSTRRYSTLPNTQLARLNPRTHAITLIPLAQASDGAYDGSTLFFTRFPFQGSYTKRYHGGTAQSIWKFSGSGEATNLTGDYTGTSKTPMVWQGRVYFLSDRDGTINLWSMDPSGKDLKQHTRHGGGFDVQSPSLANGRIVYQLGADLRVYDIAANRDAAVPVRLVSDFDQMRDRWVKAPADWISTAHVSPNGDRVVFTARGQLFVVPAQQGRIVEATRDRKARFREGRFFPDGRSLLALSDKSGEVEFWRVPANGIGDAEQLTKDAKVLRWDGIPSPDGKHIAHWDKDQQLWVYDVASKAQTRLASSNTGDFQDIQWSPDSRWVAYSAPVDNEVNVLFVYNAESHAITRVTTDRYESFSPAWTPDGKWLFFLSNRTFASLVPSPWGSRQPEPFFDKQTKIYHLALKRDERSPFQPDDELHPRSEERKTEDAKEAKDAKDGKDAKDAKDAKEQPKAVKVDIDLDGIQTRLLEVPVPAGNYSDLTTDGKRLYYVSADTTIDAKRALKTMAIDNKRGTAPDTFMEDVAGYELTLDGKKLLLRKGSDYYVVDAGAKAPAAAELGKSQVLLKDWTFDLDPRDEWRQMFLDAWRLERDYFYDRGMNGVNWPAMKDRFLPLVDRVTDRAELNDILAQMVGELSALHIFVRGGDVRRGQDNVTEASLGATFARDDAAGGFRVAHIYRTDPDNPAALSPLARQGVGVQEGDVIESINGVPALSVADIGALLRNEADRQVLVRVGPKGGGSPRDVIVVPITVTRENAMRYDEWEYTRRLQVDKASKNTIGYVHLRAMGGGDMAQWAREFYPVFDRDGLIIDVRHNNGGNIDSWLLEKLLRKAWFYWQPRVGRATWNMQYAFRGHIVVLTDENTASDGEAFAEGFRRLGLGKVIGTRTWGGEIWLSSSNFLVDRGIATAAETGVFGPEGQWLIEGHGVDPDIVVDNLPHAAYEGKDAQLEAALAELQAELKAHPVPAPKAPAYPKKGGGS
jgi:tricorn protease